MLQSPNMIHFAEHSTWGPLKCKFGFLFSTVQLSPDSEGPLDFHGHGSCYVCKAVLLLRVHIWASGYDQGETFLVHTNTRGWRHVCIYICACVRVCVCKTIISALNILYSVALTSHHQRNLRVLQRLSGNSRGCQMTLGATPNVTY